MVENGDRDQRQRLLPDFGDANEKMNVSGG